MKKSIFILSALAIIIGVFLLLFSSKKKEDDENGILTPTTTMSTFTLTSTSFEANGLIPTQHTCDGENFPPELAFSGVPAGTVSLALIMDDPDIPENVKQRLGSDTFDHWIVFNILPGMGGLSAPGAVPPVEGVHSGGRSGYTGPCPPDREHRYFFKLYALDAMLGLKAGATKADVEKAMEGHIIAQTELVGRYDRKR